MKLHIFFLIGLLTSCSSFHQKKKSELIADPVAALKTWCWSGEGKGRIIQDGETYILSFEDRQVVKGWLLSLDHPFRGEELFQFDWSNSTQVRLVANFPREFDQSLLKKYKLSSEQIWSMINTWGEIVRWIQESPAKDCIASGSLKYSCPFGLQLTGSDGRWSLERKSVGGEKISFSGDESNLSLQLMSVDGKTFFSLDLAYSECQKN